ncbi:sugar-phosphatase [Wohlfahrtiimonas larvae]|uniref:Sugar-phosphatase n=1 Tax=Wohlfahrtiimonas larvae TaxID=1157986 RepID=A0ABP9MWN2_9GAMM|nr:sugar-phosphatase [Wohlfahrtiimonas larvae]
MSIKLIAIDLDGTLLNEQHIVSDRVKQSIQYAQDKGVQVVLASGRPYSGMAPILHDLGIYNDKNYVITNNGAMIRDITTGEIVYDNVLSYEDYLKIEALSRELNVFMHVASDQCIYTANREIGRYTAYEAYLSNIPLFYKPLEEMNEEIYYSKCMLSDEPELLASIEKKIPAKFYEDYEVFKSASFYLEFLRKNSTKGYALQKIATELNLKSSEMMCMGDHENDFSMFKVADTKIAMGNGIDLLKEHATFITETNQKDGVAIAIEKYI